MAGSGKSDEFYANGHQGGEASGSESPADARKSVNDLPDGSGTDLPADESPQDGNMNEDSFDAG